MIDSICPSETSDCLRTLQHYNTDDRNFQDWLYYTENIRPYLINLSNICVRKDLSYKELIFACPIQVLDPPRKKKSFMQCRAVSAAAKPSPSRPQVRQIYFCGLIQRYVYKENKQTMINDVKEVVRTWCIIILTSRKT
jgi:hypothetical protein